jgi:TRAP-type C4-dicarboxylate transport system permease small subunit
MDSVVGRFSPRIQSLMNCITSFACAGLIAAMTYYTAKLTVFDYQTHFQLSTIVNPVKWPIESIIPFGFVLLFIQSIRNAVSSLNTYKMTLKKELRVSAVVPGKEQA